MRRTRVTVDARVTVKYSIRYRGIKAISLEEHINTGPDRVAFGISTLIFRSFRPLKANEECR